MLGLKRGIISLLLGITVLSHGLAASEVDQGTRTDVIFTETLPKPLGEARITARLDAAKQNLERLEVLLAGRPVHIPRRAFGDLPKPNLRTLELFYSPGDPSDPRWYAVIKFEYGDPVIPFPIEGRDRFSSVEIAINQKRAKGRIIFRAEKGGSSEFQEW